MSESSLRHSPAHLRNKESACAWEDRTSLQRRGVTQHGDDARGSDRKRGAVAFAQSHFPCWSRFGDDTPPEADSNLADTRSDIQEVT